jgi:hypothetical protein
MVHYAGKPRRRVRLFAWQWLLIHRRKATRDTPSMVARETRLSRDVVCAVFAGIPASIRWRACPKCNRANYWRQRTCDQCGTRITMANVAESIAFSVVTQIAHCDARHFVDVVRFKSGEITLADQSKVTRIAVWSGPSNCSNPKEFRPKLDNGRPLVLEVIPGAGIPLPEVIFNGHAIALIGDCEGAITLRLRG